MVFKHARASVLSVIWLAVSAFSANAQTRAEKIPPLHRPYLQDLVAAEKALPAAVMDAALLGSAEKRVEFLRKHSAALQMLATHRAFAGDVDGAMAAFDMLAINNPVSHAPPAVFDELKAVDAIAAIVEEAKKRRVVILNEAHHVPMHRAFAMRLARELKKIGYSYLACETFEDEHPMARGFVDMRTGYYSKEPVFAEFLRDAAHNAWKFIAYEPFAEQQTRLSREIGEAENLISKVFKQDAKAKVFVYVGYSHALKDPVASNATDFAWMAAQLKRLSGIDPLSIDQTTMHAHTAAAAEHPAYRAALARFPSNRAFVLQKPSGHYELFGKYKNGMDMQVIHPAYGNSGLGRAEWLWSLAERRAVPIPTDMLAQRGRRLLLAFHQEDAEDAVPVDALLMQDGSTPSAFALPAGQFRFEVQALPAK